HTHTHIETHTHIYTHTHTHVHTYVQALWLSSCYVEQDSGERTNRNTEWQTRFCSLRIAKMKQGHGEVQYRERGGREIERGNDSDREREREREKESEREREKGGGVLERM